MERNSIFKRTHTRTHARTYACTYTHTHTYTYIYTHSQYKTLRTGDTGEATIVNRKENDYEVGAIECQMSD